MKSIQKALTEVWNKLIPTLMSNFEGVKSSVQEVIIEMEISRKQVKPEDVTVSLKSHDKTSTDKELLPTD